MAAKKREGPGLLDQIRQAIRGSGQTLTQLERDTGVSRGELSRFLRGQRVLGGDPLERICDALNLRLIGGEGASASAKPEPAKRRQKGKAKREEGKGKE